jgi:mono/diheme cytochrome c family protein
MSTRITVIVVGLVLAAGSAAAQTTVKSAPIKPTSAADAKQMFASYCAVCHGTDAKGNGPAASALKKPPADLTRISARNGGTFPIVNVRRFIEGADEIAAHGTRAMPMWGEAFRSLDANTALIRVNALAEYLKSLQQ